MIAHHALFLALFVGTTGFFTVLAALNVRHGERAVAERREWVGDRLGVEDVDKLLDYHRLTTGASLLRQWLTVGAVLLVLYSGALAAVVAGVRETGLAPLAQGVAFFALVIVAYVVASLPLDAFDTFGIEEAFGFNRQSIGLWLRDKVLGTAVSLAISLPLVAAVLWLLEAFPTYWWVAALALYAVFAAVMQVLLPRVIMPLFYDFEPIEAGELRDAVESVFDRAGFSCEEIYTMDASRRSSHSNAFFAGFGRTKRVVLFDTLIDQMDEREIQGVLAHELAHWKRHHVWKQLAGSLVRIGAALAVANWLIGQPWLAGLFGVPDVAYAELLLAVLWLAPLLELTAPVENWLSLRHEREADDFAAEVMGSGRPLVDALCKLTGENLSNPFPHPAYATWHYTHPPVPERIRRLTEDDAA
ncbi:peptidase M48 [Halobacteriales archaeon QS_1_67_19]|nr:MAG: peptidase M48 [Halobacteriales archaeon QS_1_67_19]